jgi:hypothetical protein
MVNLSNQVPCGSLSWRSGARPLILAVSLSGSPALARWPAPRLSPCGVSGFDPRGLRLPCGVHSSRVRADFCLSSIFVASLPLASMRTNCLTLHLARVLVNAPPSVDSAYAQKRQPTRKSNPTVKFCTIIGFPSFKVTNTLLMRW